MEYKLEEVRAIAADRFTFDRDHYPNLPEGEQVRLFAQRHLLLHLNKNIGAIAGVVEPGDHGESQGNVSAPVIGKLIVNALRLADVSGVTMEELQASILNWSEGKER